MKSRLPPLEREKSDGGDRSCDIWKRISPDPVSIFAPPDLSPDGGEDAALHLVVCTLATLLTAHKEGAVRAELPGRGEKAEAVHALGSCPVGRQR